MKHPILYETHRSSIVNITPKLTETLPLYLSGVYKDYKTID